MNRRAALFCLLYLAGILYLSLYPWQFVARPGPQTLGWIPILGRRVILDAFLNMMFYMPLGAAAFLAFRRGAPALIAAAALGTLVSFSVEWAQLSIPTRYGNLLDLLSNSAGALSGALVAFVATHPRVAPRLRVLQSPVALLVSLWILWQAFAFLLSRNPSGIETSHELVGLFTIISLRIGGMRRVAMPLLLAWLAFDELRPFQFHDSPQEFWWVPFQSWFAGAPESFYGVVSGKLFLYTATVWTLRESHIRWMVACAIPTFILAAGEWAQRYLPGRTPESTDLVLLAAGAFLLRCVYDNKD